MTPFKSIMQYLEQMVPQQTMTARAMQMSVQMERIAIQVPQNAVTPIFSATWILNST